MSGDVHVRFYERLGVRFPRATLLFIERLWRSLKYECVYLHAFQDGGQARQEIGTWLRYYNEERPHSVHADDRTPMEEYTLRRAA
jgi:putative transposase